MFKAKCNKVIEYNLEISEDIVKFCQWIVDIEQDDAFGDSYTTVAFLDDIANKAPLFAIRNSKINIEYYK